MWPGIILVGIFDLVVLTLAGIFNLPLGVIKAIGRAINRVVRIDWSLAWYRLWRGLRQRQNPARAELQRSRKRIQAAIKDIQTALRIVKIELTLVKTSEAQEMLRHRELELEALLDSLTSPGIKDVDKLLEMTAASEAVKKTAPAQEKVELLQAQRQLEQEIQNSHP